MLATWPAHDTPAPVASSRDPPGRHSSDCLLFFPSPCSVLYGPGTERSGTVVIRRRRLIERPTGRHVFLGIGVVPDSAGRGGGYGGAGTVAQQPAQQDSSQRRERRSNCPGLRQQPTAAAAINLNMVKTFLEMKTIVDQSNGLAEALALVLPVAKCPQPGTLPRFNTARAPSTRHYARRPNSRTGSHSPCAVGTDSAGA